MLQVFKEWSMLFSLIFTAISASCAFYVVFNNLRNKRKVHLTAISSVIMELVTNHMMLTQEAKLFLIDNYKFSSFVRDNTWREVKVSMREMLDTELFNMIDSSYFSLYQVESILKRLHDYNEYDNPPTPLVETSKNVMEKSIDLLKKYTNENTKNGVDNFSDWVRTNK